MAFQIADTEKHVIKPGESLWLLAERKYKVPVWLLRQYNPDLNLDRVNPGTVVKFPRSARSTRRRSGGAAAAPCKRSRKARTDADSRHWNDGTCRATEPGRSLDA
jgi:LysM repeat protein